MAEDPRTLEDDMPVLRSRRWYARRDLWFVVVVGTIIIGYYAYAFSTAEGRITPALQTALDTDAKRFNIVVTSGFAPEQFHMAVYQRYGSMRGTDGKNALLYRVKPADVRRLARKYWIEKIDLAPAN